MSIPAFAWYLVALVALAVVCVLYARKRMSMDMPIHPSSWAWMAPSVLVLIWLAYWDTQGLINTPEAAQTVPLTAFAIAASGAVALMRESVWSWYKKRSKDFSIVSVVALAITICFLGAFVIEVPFNELFPNVGPTHFYLELLLVALLMAGLYFLGQRHSVLCCVGLALFFVTGIGQYFIKIFIYSTTFI